MADLVQLVVFSLLVSSSFRVVLSEPEDFADPEHEELVSFNPTFHELILPQSHPTSQAKVAAAYIQDPRRNRLSSGRQVQPVYSYGTTDPDSYRCAPLTAAPDQPFVITEEGLRKLRSEFMYPYFDQCGESQHGDFQVDIHQSSPQLHKNLNFQLPFFGFRYNYTRVSINGYLEFSDPPEHFNYPLSFPVKDWPAKNDPAFIGIFYSRCRIGELRQLDVDRRKPGVYFRLERDLQSRTDRIGIEMRERVTWDIREGVVGAKTFLPKHAAIITWKNISFSGGIDSALYTTNTFQMVLATDEVYTYAIFNYAYLGWTTHTEARGDTTTGEGGTPAFIGFNGGNGTRSFEYTPYSQQMTIRDLTGRGWANGFPGRHIFRIDENILLGTCNKDISGANLPLVFAPESGNMLGGTVVNITGPCFDKSMQIRCRFDYKTVTGKVVDTNRAICVQPFIMAEGYIFFEVSVDGTVFNWKGKYFIETPATAIQKIYFEDSAVHETKPANIRITWDKHNLTSAASSNIQISIYGYREIETTPELVYIDTLVSGLANEGAYTISPSEFKSRRNTNMYDITFGFIQINLTNPTQYEGLTVSPVLWSPPIPLGWYFAPQWEAEFGDKWAERLCDRWTMYDRYLKNFAAEIAQCPCTLAQARMDKGRFMPEFDCDIDSNRNCPYNQGAIHCVKTGSPNLDGSEQQCCYDKNSYLMLSYDQQWGSNPRRSSNLGILPWNEANKVPTLSQWFHDIAPFYMCCLWQEEQAVGCETYRFERRPSQDCVAYQAPYVGTVFGDPHVITFDGYEYTFNGKGEFVLVHTPRGKLNLDVQARFEQVADNIYGPVMATQLTSVAARDNSSARIEVRIRPPYAQWRYKLDVFADGKRIYFDRPSLRVQHFSGVTVYQPSYILNQSQIVIMFQSGAGVEVIENKGFMATRVYLPWNYINQTRGLLGNWSFDVRDDFTKPDGTVYPLPASQQDLQFSHNYALNWLLDDRSDPKTLGQSLFVHEYGRSSSYYANRTFVPEFRYRPRDIIPPNRTDDIVRANDLCGDSTQCQYDYSVSLNRDMAFATLMYYKEYATIRDTSMQRIISCGVLETPRFGKKSTFFFIPDTKVQFECNQDFTLVGDERRVCTPQGYWDVPPIGYTECLRQQEYSLRAIGYAMGYIGLFVVPVIITIVFIAFHLFKRRQKALMDVTYEDNPKAQPIS